MPITAERRKFGMATREASRKDARGDRGLPPGTPIGSLVGIAAAEGEGGSGSSVGGGGFGCELRGGGSRVADWGDPIGLDETWGYRPSSFGSSRTLPFLRSGVNAFAVGGCGAFLCVEPV
mmetsp:Transcript_42062/g.83008  ORF Transcript_42062/g.83008 Transcript_42062/m.83008 type:complete len:120 (-) Transcript_42062:584-943(-)